jgi:PAS domain S-box-containing protein
VALEAGRMGAWDWDVRSGRISWSPGLEAIHGLSPGSFGGTLEAFERDIHPEDLPRVRETLAAAVGARLGAGSAYEVEYRIVRPDGATRWVGARGRVLRDGAGRPIGMSGVCMDVTDRRRAEEDREGLPAREREARAEAEAAVRAREAFLARASHELRTPLTSAIASAHLLRRALAGETKEPPQGLLDIATRNLDTMLALINNLLDASKLAAGGVPLERQAVDLADPGRRSVQLVEPQAREKGVAVGLAVPRGLVVAGDPLKLEQVLVNLLANAVRWTPAGGRVTLEAFTEAAAADESVAVIRVRDTGQGIAAEHLERIFEPFYQVSGPRGQRARGTGLGLAICRQIVELHRGTIRAESDGPGTGSTFTIRLPIGVTEGRAA